MREDRDSFEVLVIRAHHHDHVVRVGEREAAVVLGAKVACELERRLGRVELARDADEEALEALDRLGAVPGLCGVVCCVQW